MTQALDRLYTLPAFSELCVITAANNAHVTKLLLLPQPLPGSRASIHSASAAPESQGTVTHDENNEDALNGKEDNTSEHGSSDAASSSLIAPSSLSSAAPRADLFGTELAPGIAVQLPAMRCLSVFTPTGCTLRLTATPAVLQRSYATTNGVVWWRSMLEIHSHLEQLRMAARAELSHHSTMSHRPAAASATTTASLHNSNSNSMDSHALPVSLTSSALPAAALGPRVLVVSDRPHVGTSTYCHLLAQYGVRLGYHPLLLDAVGESSSPPRFGYPSCLSLFALQYAFDVEEEMQLVPGLHAVLVQGREENANLYLHGLRGMMTHAMKRMAAHDRSRVGGLFVDYGVVSAYAVAHAEEQERDRLASGGGGGGGAHAKDTRAAFSTASSAVAGTSASTGVVNPLDTLLDTMEEAEIDHVIIVQSAWLRFKLVQRARERYGNRCTFSSNAIATATNSNHRSSFHRMAGKGGRGALDGGIALTVPSHNHSNHTNNSDSANDRNDSANNHNNSASQETSTKRVIVPSDGIHIECTLSSTDSLAKSLPSRTLRWPCHLLLVEDVSMVRMFSRDALRRQRWFTYFFGTPTAPLRPTLITMETRLLRIASVGESKLHSMSTLMPMMDDDDAHDRHSEELDADMDGEDESNALGSSDANTNVENSPRLGRSDRTQAAERVKRTRRRAASSAAAATVSFFTIDDVPLKGRVVGISSAKEYVRSNSSVGSAPPQRVPFAEMERQVRSCLVTGFALVESVSPSAVVLLVSRPVMEDRELGVCLLLTNEYLATSAV